MGCGAPKVRHSRPRRAGSVTVDRGRSLLSISKPMKRHSVRYYNDTARAAISASPDSPTHTHTGARVSPSE
ncbi:hypothetical protein MAHJHV63_54860 [Mycobacterium avium subsp. hominissuis]